MILKEQFELGFLPRSSIDACVSYIRTLLTEAVATENSPETAYWISQQGVRCLLAELELYAGQYEKAVEWANLVLTTAGGYDLFTETNYRQLWNGGAGPESLFSRHTTVPFYLDLRYDTEKGDFLEVSEDLAGSYDAEDLRGAESLYPKEFPGETVGETITMRCLGKYNRMNWDATEISCIHKLRTVTACFMLAEATASRAATTAKPARRSTNTLHGARPSRSTSRLRATICCVPSLPRSRRSLSARESGGST